MKYNLSRSEIKIGEKIIRNRTVCSPVSINMATENGEVTENIISYFSNLSKNHLGMVTVGATSVSDEGGDTKNGMHAGKKIHFEGLKKLSKQININGAASILQLFHVGAQGNTNYSGQRVVGPSDYIVPDIGIQAEVLSIDEVSVFISFRVF